jgi:hypothetical protein
MKNNNQNICSRKHSSTTGIENNENYNKCSQTKNDYFVKEFRHSTKYAFWAIDNASY